MPVSTDWASALAKSMLDLYSTAETDLLTLIARRLARGIDEPGWADRQLLAVQAATQDTAELVARLRDASDLTIGDVLRTAWNRGAALAGTDLVASGVHRALAFAGVNQRAVSVLIDQARNVLQPVGLRVQSTAGRIYRDVLTDIAGRMLTGTVTRRQAAVTALTRFADTGVTGFVDSAGRGWSLPSYAEMTARTAASQAIIQGHTDQLVNNGRDLVMISDAPEECAKCRPWEGKIVSLTGSTPLGRQTIDGHEVTVSGTLRQAISEGLHHPNCFPGETLVTAPSGVVAADSRWFEGHVFVIHTSSGNDLTVTPNHPILTPEGWVAAGSLQVGDRVFSYHGRQERHHLTGEPRLAMGLGPDDHEVPTPISDVFDSLRQASAVPAMRVPSAAEQFHGDGGGSDVNVVFADGLLLDHLHAEGSHRSGDLSLLPGGVGSGSLLADRPLLEVAGGPGHASDGSVGSVCEFGSSLGADPVEATGQRLATTDLRSGLLESVGDGGLTDSKGGRDLALSLAGLVAVDDVCDVEVRQFAGHVYNLQTGSGWYTASSIVVHNCRHREVLYLPGITKPLKDTADPEGNKLRTKQRYMERRVRELKRRVAVAQELDPRSPETAAAKAKLRAYQAEFKRWREENGRKNLSYRTSLTAR